MPRAPLDAPRRAALDFLRAELRRSGARGAGSSSSGSTAHRPTRAPGRAPTRRRRPSGSRRGAATAALRATPGGGRCIRAAVKRWGPRRSSHPQRARADAAGGDVDARRRRLRRRRASLGALRRLPRGRAGDAGSPGGRGRADRQFAKFAKRQTRGGALARDGRLCAAGALDVLLGPGPPRPRPTTPSTSSARRRQRPQRGALRRARGVRRARARRCVPRVPRTLEVPNEELRRATARSVGRWAVALGQRAAGRMDRVPVRFTEARADYAWDRAETGVRCEAPLDAAKADAASPLAVNVRQRGEAVQPGTSFDDARRACEAAGPRRASASPSAAACTARPRRLPRLVAGLRDAAHLVAERLGEGAGVVPPVCRRRRGAARPGRVRGRARRGPGPRAPCCGRGAAASRRVAGAVRRGLFFGVRRRRRGGRATRTAGGARSTRCARSSTRGCPTRQRRVRDGPVRRAALRSRRRAPRSPRAPGQSKITREACLATDGCASCPRGRRAAPTPAPGARRHRGPRQPALCERARAAPRAARGGGGGGAVAEARVAGAGVATTAGRATSPSRRTSGFRTPTGSATRRGRPVGCVGGVLPPALGGSERALRASCGGRPRCGRRCAPRRPIRQFLPSVRGPPGHALRLNFLPGRARAAGLRAGAGADARAA